MTRAISAAALPTASPDATKLLLRALNDMIDMTSPRRTAFTMHPPAIVYRLLFLLASGCSLLAGATMAGSRLHMLVFTAVVALTIYATLDIEYPRLGLIRLTSRDQVFIDLERSIR